MLYPPAEPLEFPRYPQHNPLEQEQLETQTTVDSVPGGSPEVSGAAGTAMEQRGLQPSASKPLASPNLTASDCATFFFWVEDGVWCLVFACAVCQDTWCR